MGTREHILDQLYQVVLSRKDAAPDSSYTAALFAKGTDTILKKIGEEAAEVLIAGKGGDPDAIVYEAADLFYHTLVLLASQGIPVDRVWTELQRRSGTSGIAEKASRPT